jgi:hypothetical protein
VKPRVLGRLAFSGGRADGIRATLTGVSSGLAALLLLSAGAVQAVPELGGDNLRYSNPLIAEPGLRPGVIATLLSLAVPVLVLAGQSIRFGAPARDQRLAALRLAGVTPGEAVLVAAAETVGAALLGALGGSGIFLLLRTVLDGRFSLPTDVLPAATWFLLVLVVVPLLAGMIGAFLLRRVIITPLGVVRRTRSRPPRLWPAVLMVAAPVVPFVIHPLTRSLVDLGHRHGVDVLNGPIITITSFALVFMSIVGVIVGTGWIGHTSGRLLHRYGGRPGMLLAGRRLMADPFSGSRTLSTLLAALIVGAWALGLRALMVTEQAAADAVYESDGRPPGDYSFYSNSFRLFQAAVLIAVVIAAAGIMVALAEGIVARRRAYAALVAVGVPRRVLGESLAWQALTPLIPAVVVALAVGLGFIRSVTTQVMELGGSSCTETGTAGQCGPGSPLWTTTETAIIPVPLPVEGLASLAGAAIAAMVLVVGVGFVFLKMSTDIEELRVS